MTGGTVAVVGDMGSAVGAAWARQGDRVVTDLTGRSEHGRRLAATPFAAQTRASLPAERSLEEALAVFVAAPDPAQ